MNIILSDCFEHLYGYILTSNIHENWFEISFPCILEYSNVTNDMKWRWREYYFMLVWEKQKSFLTKNKSCIGWFLILTQFVSCVNTQVWYVILCIENWFLNSEWFIVFIMVIGIDSPPYLPNSKLTHFKGSQTMVSNGDSGYQTRR